MQYRRWLENEYAQWIGALQTSSVHNFKGHPMVQRMLGNFVWPEEFEPPLSVSDRKLIEIIDQIGNEEKAELSGVCWRFVYYAQKILKRNPQSIIEIGGGSGQFYAVLRALGYQGNYFIHDLPEVKLFQFKYLREVERQTQLHLDQTSGSIGPDSFCVSLYALGEFDDESKGHYVENVVKRCPHGFIIWNPHSGANPTIRFRCIIADELPLLSPGNKQLEW